MPILILSTVITTIFLVHFGFIEFDKVVESYPIGVVFILLSLDVLSRLLLKTKAPEKIGLYFSERTDGVKTKVLVLCGLGMFVISSLINNLAALFVLFPIIATLFAALQFSSIQKFICLGLVISACNLGGAATPIGDLPAILLMDTGVITFSSYLGRALPLFLLTIVIIIAVYMTYYSGVFDQATKLEKSYAKIGVLALMQDYKFVEINKFGLLIFIITFSGMLISWSAIDPGLWPFHYTAISGLLVALALFPRGICLSVLSEYDLSPIVLTSIVLFIGTLVSGSSLLDSISLYLVKEIDSPPLLLLAMAVLIFVASGLFQAGPAAAVVLPMVVSLEQAQLAQFGPWVFITYAASICAGSSMFLWSATAGIALSGQAESHGISFDWKTYLKFGAVNSTLQFLISIVVIGVFIGELQIYVVFWLLALFLPKLLKSDKAAKRVVGLAVRVVAKSKNI